MFDFGIGLVGAILIVGLVFSISYYEKPITNFQYCYEKRPNDEKCFEKLKEFNDNK